MKKHHGGEEDKQVPPTEQIAERDRLALVVRTLAATRALVVYLSWVDEVDDTGACHREAAHEVENPVITDILAEHADQTGRDEVAPVVEAFVAADPRIESALTDQTEGERRDRGRDHR